MPDVTGKRAQRLVTAASGPKAIRKVVKLLLVHLRQDRRQRSLHDLVLDRRYPEWTLPSVPLRNPATSARLWTVRPLMQPLQKREKPPLQSAAVLLHADSVHSRGLPALQSLERPQQHLPVQVTEQVVEWFLPMRPSTLPDACQPEFHRVPVPVYGRCPFGTPWWPRRLPSTRVTRLHRYYSAIRLPRPRLPSSPLRLVPAYSRAGENRGSPRLPS